MKRTLFAVFLAVMLVAALVFIAAPEAKAATILTPADADENGTITISTAGQILDLQGASLTVVFAEDVELSVIDTTIKQEKDGTNNAGTLTVEGAGSIAAVSVDPTSRMRFLAIATDGVYSAYPFNLAISQAGINTIAKNPDDKTLEEPATCIRASFMAFKPVIDEIDAYGFIVNGNKYAATKTFTTNITHAYADLQGTLRESIIDNPVSIQAYMTINEKDYVSSAVTVIPREVLKGINEGTKNPTTAQLGRIRALMGTNTRVNNIFDRFRTSTIDFSSTEHRTSQSTTQQVWENAGVVLTNNKTSNSNNIVADVNPVRFYANSELIIECAGMTKIVFTCSSSTYASAMANSFTTGSVTTNDKIVTVVFDTPVDSVTVTMSAQSRVTSLAVTFGFPDCTHEAHSAKCEVAGKCLDCDTPVAALSHIDGNSDNICDLCDKEMAVTPEPETPVSPTTVTVSIADYATANSWANSTKYTTLKMDDAITVTAVGGSNTGKYYTSGTNWRIYQNESPSVTVTATNGMTISTVKITYSVDKTGILTLNGANVSSGTEVNVNASSVTFSVGNTGSATNGQVRITAIEVVYTAASGSTEPETPVDPPVEEPSDPTDPTIPTEPETTTVTFALGANGSASHSDGSSKTAYSETVNGYTLSITGGTNMYTGARDAMGNSCVKFGSSKNAGSCTFTVPNDVTSVVIYVAQYKANTTKINVNGTNYTIETASNNGAYTAITVDTTSNKTITFTTVSGGIRAMVNTIEFIG